MTYRVSSLSQTGMAPYSDPKPKKRGKSILLKRKRTTTKSVPKYLRRKFSPTMITSRLLTTPLKRQKKNNPMTRKKRRTTTTTIPSLNQTRKIKVSRKRQLLRPQNRKRKSLCLSNPLPKQGRRKPSLPSKQKTNPRVPPDPKRRKQR